MRTGSSRPTRRPALVFVAIFASLSLLSAAGCADNSPVAAPTSTLPEKQPGTDSTDPTAEVDIPEYDTDLDLNAEEEQAVEGALVALDGYIATLNQTFSSGGEEDSHISDFAQGEALKALRSDSKELQQSQKYMAGEFAIEDRFVHELDADAKQVTLLTCVDNGAFATVAQGQTLPSSEPEPLRVVFIAQQAKKQWKIDSQNLWSEPCDQ